MYYLLLTILGLSYMNIGSTYVLLQVRKQDDNHSNVDAVIHKVVRSEKVGQIANKFARKRFSHNERSDNENNIDNVVLSIDTGAIKESTKTNTIEFIDKIMKSVSSFVNNQPSFRTQDFIKPQVVNFRADKPSIMFEINSKSIINALRELVSSKSVSNYVDKITKNAAIVYRTLQDEFLKNP